MNSGKKKTKITNIRNQTDDASTDSTDIKRAMKYAQNPLNFMSLMLYELNLIKISLRRKQ